MKIYITFMQDENRSKAPIPCGVYTSFEDEDKRQQWIREDRERALNKNPKASFGVICFNLGDTGARDIQDLIIHAPELPFALEQVQPSEFQNGRHYNPVSVGQAQPRPIVDDGIME